MKREATAAPSLRSAPVSPADERSDGAGIDRQFYTSQHTAAPGKRAAGGRKGIDMTQKNEKNPSSCAAQGGCSRLGKVGGQAVLEGVMMKAGDHVVTTCRKEDGSLTVTEQSFRSARAKNKALDLPIIRGVVNFIEMLVLSTRTLEASAAALGLEEEEETKFEKWLKKHFGVGLVRAAMVLGTVLGILLAIGLFIFLPNFLVETVLNGRQNGLECDAVVHLRNGKYGLVEVKLGGDNLVEEAAKTLSALEKAIDTEKMKSPSFKMVLTAVGSYAYKRKDGIWVVPVTCLGG